MIIKIWFGLISAILIGSLTALISGFNFLNILHWISLLAIVWTIGLTVLIYLDKPYKNDLNKLKRIYSDFLIQKDKRIEELQKKNDIILKTAMRNQNEVLMRAAEQIQLAKMEDKNIEFAEIKRKLEDKK